MNAVSQPNKKPFLLLIAVFAIANAVDFIIYGQHLYNLAAVLGLLLMVFGILRDKNIASTVGAIVAIAAIAAKYL